MGNRYRPSYAVAKCMLKITGMAGIIAILCVSVVVARGYRASAQLPYVYEANFLSLQNEGVSTIIFCGDSAVIIDTGYESNSDYILNCLETRGIEKLSAVIVTCPSDEHIGGAVSILSRYPEAVLILPSCQKQLTMYDLLLKYTDSEKRSVIIPTHNKYFSLNGVNFTVLPPLEHNYSEIGNYSLGVLVTIKGKRIFFTGDAGKRRISEFLEYQLPNIDILVIPDHGKYNENTIRLIQNIQPVEAIQNGNILDTFILNALSSVNSKVLDTANADLVIQFNS